MLRKSQDEWAMALLEHFASALASRRRKYDSKWTLDVLLLEESAKTETIRECFSDGSDIFMSGISNEISFFKHSSFGNSHSLTSRSSASIRRE